MIFSDTVFAGYLLKPLQYNFSGNLAKNCGYGKDGAQLQIKLFIFLDATFDGYQLKPLQYNFSGNSVNNCGLREILTLTLHSIKII